MELIAPVTEGKQTGPKRGYLCQLNDWEATHTSYTHRLPIELCDGEGNKQRQQTKWALMYLLFTCVDYNLEIGKLSVLQETR